MSQHIALRDPDLRLDPTALFFPVFLLLVLLPLLGLVSCSNAACNRTVKANIRNKPILAFT